jgi:hypothetical protein
MSDSCDDGPLDEDDDASNTLGLRSEVEEQESSGAVSSEDLGPDDSDTEGGVLL